MSEFLDRNPIEIRSLKAGLTANIKFIEELFKQYPESTIKLHSCPPKQLLKSKVEKKVEPIDEEKLKTYAMPRYRTLLETHKKYKEMIKNFEAIQVNRLALKIIEESKKKDREGSNEGNEGKKANDINGNVENPKGGKPGFRINEQINPDGQEGFDDSIPFHLGTQPKISFKENINPPQNNGDADQPQDYTSTELPENGGNLDKSLNENPEEEPNITEKQQEIQGDQPKKTKIKWLYGKRRYALKCRENVKRNLDARIAVYEQMLKATENVKIIIDKHKERIKEQNVSFMDFLHAHDIFTFFMSKIFQFIY